MNKTDRLQFSEENEDSRCGGGKSVIERETSVRHHVSDMVKSKNDLLELKMLFLQIFPHGLE